MAGERATASADAEAPNPEQAMDSKVRFDAGDGQVEVFERLALVGERKWEQRMAAFCKPFTSARVRYFDRSKVDEARAWLRE